jgi:hypothetical protein
MAPFLLDFFPVRGLTFHKEGLRVLTFAAKLERSKVLVPMPIGNDRGIFAPLFQGEKIFHRDVALFGTVKEMLAELIR